MADMLVTFSCLAPPRGRRAVICGSNGGFSVLTADDFIHAGFELPQLATDEQQDIHDKVARFSNTDAGMMLRNPFDITNVPSPEGQYAIMQSLAASKRFDILVAQVSISNSGWPFVESPFRFWPDMFLDALLRVHREVDKPVAVILHSITNTGEFERLVPLREKCQAAGLPVYDSIPRAALAMDRFLRYHEKRQP
jgi:acyl-CoA synthetase (NDP forming)